MITDVKLIIEDVIINSCGLRGAPTTTRAVLFDNNSSQNRAIKFAK